MSVFGKAYSKYYDLLYKDKKYDDEYAYICKILKKFSVKEKDILDIGCGTGKHLQYFKNNGFTVSGVDMSDAMINEAKITLKQEENLIQGKASEFKFDKKFNIITSLFHVMSYQTENKILEEVFLNISRHLNTDGLFIFDFWYGPAVLSDPPKVCIKRLEDNDIKITRITEPVMNYNENTVDVNFEIISEDKTAKTSEIIHETHKMRYLFIPEILYFAEKAGLIFRAAYKWLEFTPLSDKSWYALVILGGNAK
jgi:SAM-dependent methyltransferase